MVIIGDAESAKAFWGCVEGVSIQSVATPAEIGARLLESNGPLVAVNRIESIDSADPASLALIRQAAPGLPVVAWLPTIRPEQVTYLIQAGYDGLVTDAASTTERADVITSLRLTREEAVTRSRRFEEAWRRPLVGGGSSMRVVSELIRLVSQRRCTVLITGETGSGKEVVAKAIHMASPRASQPMVSINCNAIPGELLEAELFGHVKGAYTGAFQNRTGRFEQANKGTLFLDEVGDMPFPLQAKLLRVLQEREIQRLGSSETVKVDVRVIAATNANLQKLVEQGKFRQDLFYRLHVAPIYVPPLRERREDIPLLVTHFLEKLCRNEQIPTKTIPRQIVEWLQSMSWPGNVRELENTIESAIAVSGDRPCLQMVDFPALLGKASQPATLFAMPDDGIDYNAVVSRFERILLGEALRISGGRKKQAAAFLNLKRSTFSAKLDVLGLGNSYDLEQEGDESLDAALQGAPA
jgi:transcriptional regulator with GAF, ATPase, and Fis domain